jgi:phosphopantetheinyl transferase (holo-ACP synthase)
MARHTRSASRVETGTDPYGAVPLQEHFQALLREKDLRDEQRFKAQSDAITAAFAAAKEAVTKAEGSVNDRLVVMNELRTVVGDVIAQQMPRGEAEQRIGALRTELAQTIGALSEKVDALNLGSTQRDGRSAGLSAAWVWGVGAVGVLAVLAGHVKFH